MYPVLPLEFVVIGTAVSLQGSAKSRAAWQAIVRSAAVKARGVENWALDSDLAITLFYFPQGEMQGDLDNVVKPILDGLRQCVFIDDSQIERIVAQRFQPEVFSVFQNPTPALVEAMSADGSALYVKVSDDLFEEIR